MPESVTRAYSAAHQAFKLAAESQPGLTSFDVRVLVALYERGGTAGSFDLAGDLESEGTSVRRSSLVLRHEFVVVDAVDGGRVRQGVQSRLRLTLRGWRLAELALRHHGILRGEVAEAA